jgi:hypothetical protein
VTGPKMTRAEAEPQVARAADQLESVRWQLLGIALSLPESPAGEADLRRVLECVLADRVLPALEDLRTVLEGTIPPVFE